MPQVSTGPTATTSRSPAPAARWSAWRVVVGFGTVSLAADMVYEGARSITGPLLGALGASALVVGLVSGAGEAMSLLLRLASGPLADRTGRYWSLTLVGYALTAVCVPLLAVTPFLGGAGLAVAAVLILTERAGKAVRSPAKSALLAQAAGAVGRGRGFAVHKALDQVGAFAGPLLVAAVLAATGVIWPALALLAVPGALAIGLLLRIRRRVPDPSVFDTAPAEPATSRPDGGGRAPSALGRWVGADLPRRFLLFAAAAGAATAGLVTFGIISFHASRTGLIAVAGIPLLYAAAMAAAALAALVSGQLYDRWHARVLFALPLLGAAVPALALSGSLVAVVAGALLWGAAVGVQDSTVKALVADLVPAARRATAYGVFAAVQGGAALAGGGLVGVLYARSLPALIAVLGATQLLALGLLAASLAGRRPSAAR
ncbi:MFS transporter [Micromonospora echinospora]|uniref:Major Facilitator Superfamily protein n=1 Tax=Micromonospora echinospora TaxID=1877 RepID=A0A1C4ZCV6_MICEC|nr:MFS transporter [Micromonospora echinospora]OZV80463.1 MFS transporter [Micromonospora echinospora]SCF30571.1 Major Facilitator Superfamily protein [Micromonospora echinospora]